MCNNQCSQNESSDQQIARPRKRSFATTPFLVIVVFGPHCHVWGFFAQIPQKYIDIYCELLPLKHADNILPFFRVRSTRTCTPFPVLEAFLPFPAPCPVFAPTLTLYPCLVRLFAVAFFRSGYPVIRSPQPCDLKPKVCCLRPCDYPLQAFAAWKPCG